MKRYPNILKEAIAELEILKTIAPKEPSVFFTLGKIYLKQEKKELAMTHLTAALDFDISKNSTTKALLDKITMNQETDDDFELKP